MALITKSAVILGKRCHNQAGNALAKIAFERKSPAIAGLSGFTNFPAS